MIMMIDDSIYSLPYNVNLLTNSQEISVIISFLLIFHIQHYHNLKCHSLKNGTWDIVSVHSVRFIDNLDINQNLAEVNRLLSF